MYVRTKSGFECNINERKLKDWTFAKALAKCDSGDESQALEGATFIVPFLLGKDGEEALMEHLKDDEGIVETAAILREVKEIIALMSAEIKKSQSSPE